MIKGMETVIILHVSSPYIKTKLGVLVYFVESNLGLQVDAGALNIAIQCLQASCKYR